MSVLHCVSSFDRKYPSENLYNKDFIFFLFLAVLYQFLQQLSFFMTFQNYIEHLSEKRFPSQIFLFLNGFTKTPLPLNPGELKSAKRDKFFLMLLTIEVIQLSYQILFALLCNYLVYSVFNCESLSLSCGCLPYVISNRYVFIQLAG